MAFIFKPDTNDFFGHCQNLHVDNLNFIVFNAEKEDIPTQFTTGAVNISGVVIAASGNTSIFGLGNLPAPALGSQIYLIKSIRDDQKGGHVNVDLKICFEDSEGHRWFTGQEYVASAEHTQLFTNGTDFGDIGTYRGFPTVKTGLITDYAHVLGSLPFEKSEPRT